MLHYYNTTDFCTINYLMVTTAQIIANESGLLLINQSPRGGKAVKLPLAHLPIQDIMLTQVYSCTE